MPLHSSHMLTSAPRNRMYMQKNSQNMRMTRVAKPPYREKLEKLSTNREKKNENSTHPAALKAAPADKLRLEFSSGVAPCVILPTEENDSFTYMVLPVRLKAN